jgi:dolichol kinase
VRGDTRPSEAASTARYAPAPPPPALTTRRELARKGIHLLSAAVPLAYAAGLPRSIVVSTLATLAALAVAVELGRARVPAVRATVERYVGALLRDAERRGWCGATWMLLAFLAAAVLLPAPVAIAAMWAVAVGDAIAALVGRWLGRHRLRSGKSVEGSVACGIATLAGALAVARLDTAPAVVAAVSATLAEWPHRPLDDNLRIVLAVGCAVTLWQVLFA